MWIDRSEYNNIIYRLDNLQNQVSKLQKVLLLLVEMHGGELHGDIITKKQPPLELLKDHP